MHLRYVRYLPLGTTTALLVVIKRVCPRNESASFQLLMCIKNIPKAFYVIMGASSGGELSRQFNVSFPLSPVAKK